MQRERERSCTPACPTVLLQTSFDFLIVHHVILSALSLKLGKPGWEIQRQAVRIRDRRAHQWAKSGMSASASSPLHEADGEADIELHNIGTPPEAFRVLCYIEGIASFTDNRFEQRSQPHVQVHRAAQADVAREGCPQVPSCAKQRVITNRMIIEQSKK